MQGLGGWFAGKMFFLHSLGETIKNGAKEATDDFKSRAEKEKPIPELIKER